MRNVRRQTIPDQVRDAIADRIMSGEYAPGMKLRELHLANEFEVSQGSIREALRDLATHRLVQIEPHRGSSVTQFNAANLAESYDVRRALEWMACETMHERPPDSLPNFRPVADAAHEAAIAGDRKAYLDLDVQFHRGIVVACGNSILLRSWDELRLLGRMVIIASRTKIPDDEFLELSRQHFPIVEALEAREFRKAGELMCHHFISIRECFITNMVKQAAQD